MFEEFLVGPSFDPEESVETSIAVHEQHHDAQRELDRLFNERRRVEFNSVEWEVFTTRLQSLMQRLPMGVYSVMCVRCDYRRPLAPTPNLTDDVCDMCYDRDRTSQRLRNGNDENNFNPYDNDEIYSYIRDDHAAQPYLEPIGHAPHFGVELEVETSNAASLLISAKETAAIFRPDKFAILKRDGSLNCGFEICTRPAAMKVHRVQWMTFFARKSEELRILNSCGLHVHISRQGLTDLMIAKMVCFINAYHNRKFIQCLAGRSSNNYCQIKKKKLTTASEWAGDRYEAVNIGNHSTIEFRMFKGTLNQSVFFKALEFCDAMRAFCMPAARSLRESMMRSEFTHFVHKNSKQWPHLDAFIQAKWYGYETPSTRKYGFTAIDKKASKLKQMVDIEANF